MFKLEIRSQKIQHLLNYLISSKAPTDMPHPTLVQAGASLVRI